MTAIKSGHELLLALGHPLMNDMKQMCERWRRRRNDGEKVAAAHTERTRAHIQVTHLQGVQVAPLQSSHGPDNCKHVPWHTNRYASIQAEVSKQAAASKHSPPEDILLKEKREGDS